LLLFAVCALIGIASRWHGRAAFAAICGRCAYWHRLPTAESIETYNRRTLNSAGVISICDRRIKRNLLPTKIEFGGRHRDFRPPYQMKIITDEHSIRRSPKRSTGKSTETYYPRILYSAVVNAIFDRPVNRNILPTNIQYGGRHHDLRTPNQAKPTTDKHSTRRSSSRVSTAESSTTHYRRTLNPAVVIAIFDRRIKFNLVPTNIQLGGRRRDF
jgi:hypothetical protein